MQGNGQLGLNMYSLFYFEILKLSLCDSKILNKTQSIVRYYVIKHNFFFLKKKICETLTISTKKEKGKKERKKKKRACLGVPILLDNIKFIIN